MEYQRVEIRFAKQDDLRWIGHRDLIRLFERLFRRLDLQLRMSEGFHPKPRMSFPSALALGVVGLNEILHIDLHEVDDESQLLAQLQSASPPGLQIKGVRFIATTGPKPRVERLRYIFPVPTERRAMVQESIERLLGQSTWQVSRNGGDKTIDVFESLDKLELREDGVSISLKETAGASVRPRELLEALELSDLESQGATLSREEVELSR